MTESFFIKKETLAQVFYCEFCQISKNTFFTEHLWATASVIPQFHDFMATSVVSVQKGKQKGEKKLQFHELRMSISRISTSNCKFNG